MSPNDTPRRCGNSLRPSAATRKCLVEEDDDDEFDPLWNPEDPYAQIVSDKLDDGDAPDDREGDRHGGGLRRTASGMLMPYEGGEEGGEDEAQAGGIVGRVLDTVNTARDIAHVNLNVAFRR